jgi:thioredoxin 1
MSENTTTLTDANFDNTVKTADKPLLVDFWAEWCGPCRMVSPILEEIAKENGDKLIVGKLNVDENPTVSARLGIRSIPTMNVYKDGELVKSIVGAKSKQALLADLVGII